MTESDLNRQIIPSRLGHVIIIGGGIGGLTLAQGLVKAGISVAVYERDRTTTDRVQGYRVHINPTGSRALHACLPAHLFDAFDRSCGRPGRGIRFLTERMGVLLSVGFDLVHQPDAIGKHRSVSRITLRQVLLSGLEPIVHFGKTFVRYEERDQRVVAQFEDGSSAVGDILVAGDGGGSRVRRQLLPHAERIDTGVIGIAGKVFLDDGNRGRIAPELRDGMALVSAKGGYSLFVALQEIDGVAPDAPTMDRIGGVDDCADRHFDDRRSYLMWALGAQRQKLGLNGGAEALQGEPLRAIALHAMAAWDDRFKTLVRLADPSTISAIPMRTARPVDPWPTRRITLLGDAIHSMTPYRGIGANIALKDALALRDALLAADRGECPAIEAIHAYEAAMLDYGFKAVRNSLRAMEQTTSDNTIGRVVSRAMFRAIDRLPPVKRWFAAGLGNE
jgi:2-polyprenyl-6-methoxyphenol hydroxylase-like FAD-dependent oxidoreductase